MTAAEHRFGSLPTPVPTALKARPVGTQPAEVMVQEERTGTAHPLPQQQDR